VAFIFVNKDKLLSEENYEKTIKNEKKDTYESKCKEQTIYETTDSKIEDLIDGISVGVGGNWKQFELFANDKKVVASDIDQLTAYHMAEISFLNSNKTTITLDEYTKEIHKYLGKDYDFNPESIDYKGSSCPQYNYNASTKVFTKQETACGWTNGPVGIYHKITKAVETEGVLEIDIRVIFGDGESKFYADYARTNFLKEYDESSLDSYYSKASAYKFTFKEEDGNYVFVSSEPKN